MRNNNVKALSEAKIKEMIKTRHRLKCGNRNNIKHYQRVKGKKSVIEKTVINKNMDVPKDVIKTGIRSAI